MRITDLRVLQIRRWHDLRLLQKNQHVSNGSQIDLELVHFQMVERVLTC